MVLETRADSSPIHRLSISRPHLWDTMDNGLKGGRDICVWVNIKYKYIEICHKTIIYVNIYKKPKKVVHKLIKTTIFKIMSCLSRRVAPLRSARGHFFSWRHLELSNSWQKNWISCHTRPHRLLRQVKFNFDFKFNLVLQQLMLMVVLGLEVVVLSLFMSFSSFLSPIFSFQNESICHITVQYLRAFLAVLEPRTATYESLYR